MTRLKINDDSQRGVRIGHLPSSVLVAPATFRSCAAILNMLVLVARDGAATVARRRLPLQRNTYFPLFIVDDIGKCSFAGLK